MRPKSNEINSVCRRYIALELSNRERSQNSIEYSHRRERENKMNGKQRQNQVHDIMTKNIFAQII